MSNDDLHRWINRELDGELPTEERGRLEDALRRDADARTLRRDLQSITGLLRSDSVGPAPVGIVSRILAACGSESDAPRRGWEPDSGSGGRMLAFLRCSAAIAAGLLLLLGAFQVARRPAEAWADDEQPAPVSAPLVPEQDYLDIVVGRPDRELPASRVLELHDPAEGGRR